MRQTEPQPPETLCHRDNAVKGGESRVGRGSASRGGSEEKSEWSEGASCVTAEWRHVGVTRFHTAVESHHGGANVLAECC